MLYCIRCLHDALCQQGGKLRPGEVLDTKVRPWYDLCVWLKDRNDAKLITIFDWTYFPLFFISQPFVYLLSFLFKAEKQASGRIAGPN